MTIYSEPVLPFLLLFQKMRQTHCAAKDLLWFCRSLNRLLHISSTLKAVSVPCNFVKFRQGEQRSKVRKEKGSEAVYVDKRCFFLKIPASFCPACRRLVGLHFSLPKPAQMNRNAPMLSRMPFYPHKRVKHSQTFSPAQKLTYLAFKHTLWLCAQFHFLFIQVPRRFSTTCNKFRNALTHFLLFNYCPFLFPPFRFFANIISAGRAKGPERGTSIRTYKQVCYTQFADS